MGPVAHILITVLQTNRKFYPQPLICTQSNLGMNTLNFAGMPLLNFSFQCSHFKMLIKEV